MTPDLCKSFAWRETTEGGLIITPWRYDDGDQIVIFARRGETGWHLDDNGETAFRLGLQGVDSAADRVQARLSALRPILGIDWSDTAETLQTSAQVHDLEPRVMALAEACAQLSALACLRQDRQASGFREQILGIVDEIARAAGVEMRRDVPVDESRSLLADAWLTTPRPVLVIAAATPQRLMEAEIIWLDAQRRQVPVYVLALVEDVRAIGIKQYTRANYYTDKTVEYASPQALADLITHQARTAPH